MNFQHLTEKVLTFCYDGPTSYADLKQLVKTHNQFMSEENLDKKTQELIEECIEKGLIKAEEISGAGAGLSSINSFRFTTTAEGERFAEEILIKNGLEEHLKYN